MLGDRRLPLMDHTWAQVVGAACGWVGAGTLADVVASRVRGDAARARAIAWAVLRKVGRLSVAELARVWGTDQAMILEASARVVPLDVEAVIVMLGRVRPADAGGLDL